MLKKMVAVYVRVSSQEQAIEGHSIDEQIARLKNYCDAKELTIYKNYIDPAYTGSNINRPAIQNLIEDVKNKKVSTVLVYKLDRLSRSQKDTLYLIEDVFLKNGCDFISMTENFDTSSPFGKAMIGILSVFAQLEREQIRERMDMGRAGRAKLGLWRGGSNAPIGYDYIDGKLIINEYEAMQVRKIFELFLDGKSFNAISDYMKERYTNKYSNYNNVNTLSAILRNKLYIGYIKYREEYFKGTHEAIIDSDMYDRANKRYEIISKEWNSQMRTPYAGKHLLTGMIFCGNCGARYFTTTTKRKDDESYSYYKCYSRDGNKRMKKMDGCKNPTYRQNQLDQIVIEEIENLLFAEDTLDNMQSNSTKRNEFEELATIEKELNIVNSKINKLLELYSIGTMPIDMVTNQITGLTEQRTKLEKSIYDLKNKKQHKMNNEEAKKYINYLKVNFDSMNEEAKKEVVRTLIDKIVILPNEDVEIHWGFNFT